MIDLHLHLDGSLSPKTIIDLAKKDNVKLPTYNANELKKYLSVPKNCKSLNDYLKCFDLPLSVLQTKKSITQAVYSLQKELKKQGLIYAEIRFAPQLHTKKGLSQEEVVKAAIKGLKKSSFKANLILCCMRGDKNHEENLTTVLLAKKYLNKGVCAIDLAGAEAIFKTNTFFKEFELAKKLNIPFTIHAGEADGPESVWDAIKFGAVRIGHGVRVTEDSSLVDYLAEKQIPLEMCPTSNRCTKAIDDMSLFPLRQLMEKGVKVTINTDDPAICRTNLKGEFDFVTNKYGITSSEKKQLLLNAVDAAFCSDEYKNELKEKIYGSED